MKKDRLNCFESKLLKEHETSINECYYVDDSNLELMDYIM